MGEGLEACGAVLRLVHFTGAEAVQKRAQDAPHMCVVVDDEETQAVEVDTDHGELEAVPAAGRHAGPQRLRICR